MLNTMSKRARRGYRSRDASYRLTAAALDTLSEPKSPEKRIFEMISQVSRVSCRKPGPSATSTRAMGCVADLVNYSARVV